MAALSKADFKVGALYRVGLRRNLSLAQVAALLEARLGMKAKDAQQIAAHWFASHPYRRRLIAFS